jgi:hypothetical protein
MIALSSTSKSSHLNSFYLKTKSSGKGSFVFLKFFPFLGSKFLILLTSNSVFPKSISKLSILTILFPRYHFNFLTLQLIYSLFQFEDSSKVMRLLAQALLRIIWIFLLIILHLVKVQEEDKNLLGNLVLITFKGVERFKEEDTFKEGA